MHDLSDLDLPGLTAFHEVARLGSVTKAAQSLGRSQPAISHRLRGLQDQLGVTLLEKVGRGLVLTPAGRLLYDHAQAFFAHARDLLGVVARSQTAVSGRVRIGTYPTIASHLLVDSIASWLSAYPELTLTFELGLAGDVIDLLRTGELDLVLSADERDVSGLEVEPIGDDQMVAALPADLSPRSSGTVTVEELRQRRLLSWTGPDDVHFGVVQSYAMQNGLLDETTPLIPSVDTLRGLVARGLGYSFLPGYTVRPEVAAGRVVALRPEGLRHRIRFYLLRRPAQPSTPAVEVVCDGLRALDFDAHQYLAVGPA